MGGGEDLMLQFGFLQPFLEEEDLGRAMRRRMLTVLQDPEKRNFLRVEMAVTVDGGRPFVLATYRLEGDGPLALWCYEELETLLQAIHVSHFPNANAVIREIASASTSSPSVVKQ